MDVSWKSVLEEDFEMLQRRKVGGTEYQPCPRIEEGEEEDPKRPEKIKEAQGLVGEAMWLSGRTRLTRPDISFMTGLMNPMLQRPEYTFKHGTHQTLLKYLVDPSQRTLTPSISDVSFAPHEPQVGARHHGGTQL